MSSGSWRGCPCLPTYSSWQQLRRQPGWEISNTRQALQPPRSSCSRSRADDDGHMRSSNLLGVIAFEQGFLDQAHQSFTVALAIARALKDTLMTARVCNNLASLADLRGSVQDALTLYRSALLSYQRLGDRRGTAESYHNLGIVFRQMGDGRR